MSGAARDEAQAAIVRVAELLRNAGTGWFATWEDAGLRFPVETLAGARVHTMRALAGRVASDLRLAAVEIGKLDVERLRPLRLGLLDVIDALGKLEREEIEAGL